MPVSIDPGRKIKRFVHPLDHPGLRAEWMAVLRQPEAGVEVPPHLGQQLAGPVALPELVAAFVPYRLPGLVVEQLAADRSASAVHHLMVLSFGRLDP